LSARCGSGTGRISSQCSVRAFDRISAENPVPARKASRAHVPKIPNQRTVAASVESRGEESPPDELWMEEALRCAQRALEAGEVPVGAVVICDGQIVGRGWNRNITGSDPTAHAEVIALREAGATVGNHRLEDCELFVTIEPCAMCAGAMVHARIQRLVYGADDPKAGAVRSVMQVLNHPQLNHQIEVRSGVLAGRSAEVLQTFFRNRR
jgi:tRNA(adenine34) deaminase